jgi:mRNA-degrading endonuclease RelE of RelBE toxin-antitoxin system
MGRGPAGPGYVISRISSSARAFLKQHREEDVAQRVLEALEILRASPFHYQQRIRPLKGKPGDEYRYRFGGVRIHYAVNRKGKTIDILNIDDRGDIRY